MSGTVAVQGTAARRRLFRLSQYRDLFDSLLRRELRVKYKGSTFGVLWTYLYPLFMMGVYTLVFSILWKAVDVVHYPLFVLTGLAVWAFFQAVVQGGASSLVANAQLIKKVWFPREVIPAATVLAQVVSAAVMFAIVVPANLIVSPETARTALLAIPIFAGVVCLALGLACLLATANVFFRDVEHLLGVLFLPWFFLTPVFYGLEQLPGAAGHPLLVEILRYGNPVTPYVEGIKSTLFVGAVPGPGALAYIFLVGPTVAVIGLWALQRFEDQMAVEL
ncbi:MAG: ABC transporter permease [Gaiellaceae bacterium]